MSALRIKPKPVELFSWDEGKFNYRVVHAGITGEYRVEKKRKDARNFSPVKWTKNKSEIEKLREEKLSCQHKINLATFL